MTDAAPEDKPARRPRYRGANPRKFAEKYKELQPTRYPADVAKVVASGKTAAGSHRAIMVAEILAALSPQPGEVAIDCTLGYGGHAHALLSATQPGGRLIALDVDPIEGPKTEARLREQEFPPEALVVYRRNFAGLAALVAAEAPGGVDLIVADLGLSSMQIDDPSRGFTFKDDGPLDMRLDPTRGRPASALLAGISEAALERLLAENADEPRAAAIAAAVVRSRPPLTTTRSLAAVVRTVYARRHRRRSHRRRPPHVSGDPDRRQRRVCGPRRSPPSPAILPGPRWSGRHLDLPLGRGPPRQTRLQGRPRDRNLRLDRPRGHPRRCRGAPGQPPIHLSQTPVRRPLLAESVSPGGQGSNGWVAGECRPLRPGDPAAHLMNSKTGLPESVSEDMLSSQLDEPLCGESHPDGLNSLTLSTRSVMMDSVRHGKHHAGEQDGLLDPQDPKL